MDIHEKEETTEDIPVACEFNDILTGELLGLPPQREIDFQI